MPATIQEARVTITEVGGGPQLTAVAQVQLITAAFTSEWTIKMGLADLGLTAPQETTLTNIMATIRNRAIEKAKAALVIP